jgi:aryl-alcohol dehydrogenase-like predicted oxidoreductase
LKELILGAVQFGMNYGIHNLTGQPKAEEVHSILDYAYAHQVRMLDTAADYCDSENVIGSYIAESGNALQICTKLSSKIVNQDGDIGHVLEDEVSRSLDRLHVDHIQVYYLHRFEQCKDDRVLSALQHMKSTRVINKIGISIYKPQELEHIASALQGIADVVQIPLNFFNCAEWLECGTLEHAKTASIDIYARSIYLQGLIFMDPSDRFVGQIGAEKYLEFFNRICHEWKMDALELAIGFVRSVCEIDAILIGCERLEQVKQNIAAFQQAPEISRGEIQRIVEFCRGIVPQAIDPRLWARG